MRIPDETRDQLATKFRVLFRNDFLDRKGPGNAIPYGIYDVAANSGWGSVGADLDTAASAVVSDADCRPVADTTTRRPPLC
jgi:hypothetical protein